MKKGINLALAQRRVDNVFRKAFLVSVALFFAVVVISLGLIIYRLILKSTFDSLDAKEQQLNQQLLAVVEKRDKFIETKSRLIDVKKILSGRSQTIEKIDTITNFLPTDASVNSLSGDQDEMQVSLESENLASLNELVEQKLIEVAADRQKGIRKVDMKTFGLNARSLKYQASFTITFN